MPTPEERHVRMERFGDAFDEIECFEMTRGWGEIGCISECGECYICGLRKAISSIKIMLITPGAVEIWEPLNRVNRDLDDVFQNSSISSSDAAKS